MKTSSQVGHTLAQRDELVGQLREERVVELLVLRKEWHQELREMRLKRVVRQDLSVTATTSLNMQLPHLLCACRLVSQMSSPDLQANLRHERLDGHGSLELVHFGEG